MRPSSLTSTRTSPKLRKRIIWLSEVDYLANPCDSGGEEVMLDVAGQDATEAFEDVGHSDEARETLDQLLVGNLKRGVRIR